MPTIDSEPFKVFTENPKYEVFGPGCIGYLDGSHYECRVPEDVSAEYRNRKGFTSMNVLGVVDPNLRWIYMLAGWEGSAHDYKVYSDAIKRDLVIPRGRYLLGDAGYANKNRILAPWRGIRYHLSEFSATGPETPEEIFNLRHSQKRVGIEKVFGRHKAMFAIFRKQGTYSLKTFKLILYGTAALDNFRQDFMDFEVPTGYEYPNLPGDDEDGDELESGQMLRDLTDDESLGGERGEMGRLRRSLAAAMWDQYVEVLKERGRLPTGSFIRTGAE